MIELGRVVLSMNDICLSVEGKVFVIFELMIGSVSLI